MATDSDSLAVEAVSPLPNPNPTALKIRLRGVAGQLRVDLWSRAFRRVGRVELAGPLGPGWTTVTLPPQLLAELPNGGYFLTVQAAKSGRSPVQARPGRFYLAR